MVFHLVSSQVLGEAGSDIVQAAIPVSTGNWLHCALTAIPVKIAMFEEKVLKKVNQFLPARLIPQSGNKQQKGISVRLAGQCSNFVFSMSL